jgi:hypothetical protein
VERIPNFVRKMNLTLNPKHYMNMITSRFQYMSQLTSLVWIWNSIYIPC